jgi:hypothetical protein
VVFVLVDLTAGEPFGEQPFWFGCGRSGGFTSLRAILAGVADQRHDAVDHCPQNRIMLIVIRAYPQPPIPMPYRYIIVASLRPGTYAAASGGCLVP